MACFPDRAACLLCPLSGTCTQDIVIPIPARIPGMLSTPYNVAMDPALRSQPRDITFFFAGEGQQASERVAHGRARGGLPECMRPLLRTGKVCGDNQEPKPPGTPWPICQTPKNPLYSAGAGRAAQVRCGAGAGRARSLQDAESARLATPPTVLGAGMRQQVYHHHAHRPGYRVVTRTPTYKEDMSRAVFCLAPTGGGHGNRIVRAAPALSWPRTCSRSTRSAS